MGYGGVIMTKGDFTRNRLPKTPLWITLAVFASMFIDPADSITIICHKMSETNRFVTYEVRVIPPGLNFGSYESYNTITPDGVITRDVIIYWEAINEADNCVGEDVYKYKIYRAYMSESGELIEIPSNYTHANSAVFSGLDVDTGFTFIAYLSNRLNLASNFTEMYVPRAMNDYKPSRPVSLTKTKVDGRDGVYELSWVGQIPPYEKPDHFLLYWCVVDDASPNQCNGQMNTTKVAITESRWNVTVSDSAKNYQFAISTNSPLMQLANHKNVKHYNHISGGMMWETCAELPKSYIENKNGLITKFWATAIGSTFMGFRWKLDCVDRTGIIKGYQIYYCTVNDISDIDCKGIHLFKYVEDTITYMDVPTVFLDNLNPATTYKISIEVLIRHGDWYGLGLHTNSRYFTTYPEEKKNKETP